jgi:spermidine synthase
MRKSLIFALILIGLTAMMGQILLMRELLVVFYGNELTLGLMLAAWLFWTGLGSWILGRLADRPWSRIRLLNFSQAVILFLLPAVLFMARNARSIWGFLPGEITGLEPMLITAFVLLAPLCLLLGFLFALGCRIFSAHFGRSVRAIGNVYILEALGASLGGLLLNFLLIRMLDPFRIVLLIGSLNLLAALLVRMSQSEFGTRQGKRILVVLFLATTLIILIFGGAGRLGWISSRLAWQPLDLVREDDSIYGRLSVTALGDQHSFFQNGLIMFSTNDAAASEEAAHFPLLEHGRPRRVLLIGGGIGGTVREILKHPVRTLDYVELDPLLIEMAEPYLPPGEWSRLHDARVRIHHTDGRLFVKRAAGRYDAVIVQLPDPSTAQLNRFYSLEFFREADRILEPDGILALSVGSAENYISPQLGRFLGCLRRTLNEVFDHVGIIPGETAHFLATDRPQGFRLEPEQMIQRLTDRTIRTRFVREYYLFDRLGPHRVSFLKTSIDQAEGFRINRDFRPVGYLYDIILWSSHFRSGFRNLIGALAGMKTWQLFLPAASLLLLLPVVMRRRSPRMPVLVAVAATGFSEIGFQVVTIIGFQVLYGYVYYQLGLILTSFMIGLVLGAWLINRRLPLLRNDLPAYLRIQGLVVLYPLLLSLILAGLAALKSGPLLTAGLSGAFALLPVLAGFIGGLQFPVANKICLESAQRVGQTAGMIYGLDLLGSCLGALLIGAVLVPALGVLRTCWWVAAMNGCVFILLLTTYLLRPALETPSRSGPDPFPNHRS